MTEPQPPTENPAGIMPGAPSPAAPPPPPAEAIVYRPVSGWAVAGFGIGALFAFVIAANTVVALAQGAPMFFPAWILSLAVVGIVCSLIGQRQIELSEGTRAGAKLARLGIWLSLLSGLGYLSYYYVTGLALQNQANEFLMVKNEEGGFFPLLKEAATKPSKLNAAFLLTLPASARAGRPDDEVGMIQLHDQPGKDGAPGPLTQFREGYFPRILYKHLADDAEITPLGVQEWKYEMRSYKIYRTYRIKTKEVELELLVAVFSTEAEAAGKERKWFVNLRESTPNLKTITRTPTGEGVKLLRLLADLWLKREIQKLNGEGKDEEGKGYPEIKRTDRSDWKTVYVRDGNRDAIHAHLHDVFASNDKGRLKQFNVMTLPEEIGKWEVIDGKIRIYHHFRFSMDKGKSPYNVTGYAILDTKIPIDPAKFDRQTLPLPEWDIVGFVFTQVTAPVLAGKAPQ